LILALLCTAASAQQTAAPPPTDASTAESALRSYWALRDWYEVAWREERSTKASALFESRIAELTRGKPKRYYEAFAAFRAYDIAPRLERRITSRREESAARVVIEANIRNVSPIPPGAQSTPFLVKMREAGEDYRYVLTREGERWHVLEVWKLWTGVMAPTEQYDSLPQMLFPAHIPPQ
jgi:hypothetical protein